MSATAVSFDNAKEWGLIDCAEATQHQILKSDLSLYHLSLICITHVHGDHCYGLPGVLSSMSLSGRKKPVLIIAPKKVIEWINHTFSLSDVSLGFDLHFQYVESTCNIVKTHFCHIEVCTLQHRVPSFAYKITETLIPMRLCLNKLQSDNIGSGPHYNQLQKKQDVVFNNKTLSWRDYTYTSWKQRVAVVCGDNEKPALLKDFIKNVDVLVHEATFIAKDLQKIGFHTGHSDAKRIAEFAERNKISLLALTHFSVRYHGEGMLNALKAEAERYFSGKIFLAFDQATLNIEATKNVHEPS